MNPRTVPPADQTSPPLGWVSVSLALTMITLWGANPVAMKISLSGFPPIAIAAMRFGLATFFMVGWCVWTRSPIRLDPQQWAPAIITGVLLFLQILTFNLGVHRTSTSHSTVLINTFIFWVVVIEHFVTRRHRLNWRTTLGLALAAIGVLLLMSANRDAERLSQTDATSWEGDLILAVSAFILAVKVVYTKRAVRVVAPGTLILWHDAIGVVLFVVASFIMESTLAWEPNAAAVTALVYQGVFVAGICFALQAVLLKRHSASQISAFSFATPLIGVTLSVLMRGDSLSPWLAGSGILVTLGILLVNLPHSETSKESPLERSQDDRPATDAE